MDKPGGSLFCPYDMIIFGLFWATKDVKQWNYGTKVRFALQTKVID